jgi:transposase
MNSGNILNIGNLTTNRKNKNAAEARNSMTRNSVEFKPPPSLDEDTESWKKWLLGCANILGATAEILDHVKSKAEIDIDFQRWLARGAQREIAEQLGVSKTTVQRHLGHYAKEYKKEQLKIVKKLHNEGQSLQMIADQIDTPKSTVQDWVKSFTYVRNGPPESFRTAENLVESSREKRRRQYEKKDKSELIELLIQRDEIIGALKKKLKDH